MTTGITNLVYTRDVLTQLNTHNLKIIPHGEKYAVLRKFTSDCKSVNLSSVVRNQVIPTYLKNKYGDMNPLLRGNPKPEKRKLLVPVKQTSSPSDIINEKIRDVLSKLSENNKDTLIMEILKLDIPNECGNSLVDMIHLFAVDLSYLIPIYVDIMFVLKNKNMTLYQQLIRKIIDTSQLSINSENKRLQLGNIMLLAEIYRRDKSSITDDLLFDVVKQINSNISPSSQDYIHVLCELLKGCILDIKQHNINMLSAILLILSDISKNSKYDKRYRFMSQDVIDLNM